MFEYLNALIEKNKQLEIPAFDMLVYHEGKQVYRYQHGMIDFDGTPVSNQTLYNLYSCSKFITCVSALLLLEKNKFSLEDDLAMYIPAFKDMKVNANGMVCKAQNKIKLKHLFTMTSGIDYDLGDKYIEEMVADTNRVCPTLESMKYIAKKPLSFEPGKDWLYGLSHDVLGAVIEVVSGKRLGEYMKENIFDKLGMKDIGFSIPESERYRIAEQFNHNEGYYRHVGKDISSYKLGSKYESGGAGLISTVDDYMSFLEGVRTFKILSEQTLELMGKDRLINEQRSNYWLTDLGYGYGLGVRTPNGKSARTDIGWNGAAGAYSAIDLKNKISVFFGMHVMSSPNDFFRPDIIECVKLDLGIETDKNLLDKNLGKLLA